MLTVTQEDIEIIKKLPAVECRLCGMNNNGMISKVNYHLLCDDCIKKIKEDTYE